MYVIRECPVQQEEETQAWERHRVIPQRNLGVSMTYYLYKINSFFHSVLLDKLQHYRESRKILYKFNFMKPFLFRKILII